MLAGSGTFLDDPGHSEEKGSGKAEGSGAASPVQIIAENILGFSSRMKGFRKNSGECKWFLPLSLSPTSHPWLRATTAWHCSHE